LESKGGAQMQILCLDIGAQKNLTANNLIKRN
jgi:hypothetical protein